MWCGVVWCGVALSGVVWCGVVWCGVVWCGVVWCGVVLGGVVLGGVVWCGVVWSGVGWCGVVCGGSPTMRRSRSGMFAPVNPRTQQGPAASRVQFSKIRRLLNMSQLADAMSKSGNASCINTPWAAARDMETHAHIMNGKTTENCGNNAPCSLHQGGVCPPRTWGRVEDRVTLMGLGQGFRQAKQTKRHPQTTIPSGFVFDVQTPSSHKEGCGKAQIPYTP